MNENFLKISHLTKSVKQTEVDQDDIEQHLTSDNKISPRQSSQISENFNVQVRFISGDSDVGDIVMLVTL